MRADCVCRGLVERREEVGTEERMKLGDGNRREWEKGWKDMAGSVGKGYRTYQLYLFPAMSGMM